jgi:ClpP class serine protease
MIDRAHICFKRHVSEARPVLKDHLDKVTTGDVWLGYDAVEMGLIDRLITSDEYIGEKLTLGCKVLKLVKYERPRFIFGSPWQIPILPGASHHHISNDSNYFWKKSCLNAITKLKQFLESPQ